MAMGQAPERGVRLRKVLTILWLLCIRALPTVLQCPVTAPMNQGDYFKTHRLPMPVQRVGVVFRLRAKFVTEHAGLMTEVGS